MANKLSLKHDASINCIKCNYGRFNENKIHEVEGDFDAATTTIEKLHLNVLQIAEIVEKILSYLDFKTLLSAHLVNLLWNNESTREILSRSFITIPKGFYHNFFDASHNKTDEEYSTMLKNQCKKEFKRRFQTSHWNNRRRYHQFSSSFFKEHDEKCSKALDDQRHHQHKLTLGLSHLLSSQAVIKTINLLVRDERDVDFFLSCPLIPQEKVKELKYDPRDARFHWSNDENLFRLLEQLPNLKMLDTSSLHLHPWDTDQNQDNNGDTDTVMGSSTGTSTNKLERLLRRLEKLETIKLSSSIGHFQRQALLHQRLRGVDTLNVDRWSSLGILSTFVDGKIEWKIKTLNLYVHGNLTAFMSRKFFNMIVGSLKHLILEGLKWDDFPSYRDDFHVPLSLVNLETMEISMKDSNYGGRKKACLVGLQLPKLKKLLVPMDAFFDLPPPSRSSTGFRLDDVSLEHLELTDSGGCIPVVPNLRLRFCSKLKTIKIHLDLHWTFTRSMIMAIFTDLIHLEHLLLNLTANFDWNEEEDEQETDNPLPKNWDELLTGLMRPEDAAAPAAVNAKDNNFFVYDCSSASIQNLQNLRSLIISTDDSRRSSSANPSDFFIYKSLIHLKYLQILSTPDNYFSTNAVQDLKEMLGPTFHYFPTEYYQ